jgi:hypothetical protein
LVDLESKLTDIMGLLSRSSAPLCGVQTPFGTNFEPPAILEYSSARPDQTAEWMSQEYLPNPEVGEGPLSSENQDSTENTLKNPWNSSAAMDIAWVTDLGLSPVVLDHLLDRFRGMASYFPFVRLPYSCTAASMAEERPFLLLAAVTAASSKYCHLQDALIRQFKESLSQRVVMAGEKDLDLLQGLLVHLAWYDPGSHVTFKLSASEATSSLSISGSISTLFQGVNKHTSTYKSQSVWSLTFISIKRLPSWLRHEPS